MLVLTSLKGNREGGKLVGSRRKGRMRELSLWFLVASWGSLYEVI